MAHPFRFIACAAALVALAGCAVYPDPYYAQPYGTVVAPYGPPPVVVENYAVAPYSGAIWISGYWSWSSGRHVWTPGRWEHQRAGYHWVPRTWEQRGHEWHQHGGHWERG